MIAPPADIPAQEKVAIITGAGAGIGKACALRLAGAGMRIVVADRSRAAVSSACTSIAEINENIIGCVAEVAIEADCKKLSDDALQKWGRIDVLMANAGVQIGGSLLESNEHDWNKIIGVNTKGAAYCCKAVLPAMLAQQSGAIVIVSSINAVVGSAGMAIYDMSKAAVLALMCNLAVEHGASGIRVNAVCPGNTITDFHVNRMAERDVSVEQIREMCAGYGLLGRAAEPHEIANAVHFLASTEASFITGHSLLVDGGFSVTGRAG